MKDLIAKIPSRFKDIELLGKGGMGAVFKARDITLDRNVALKVILPRFARRPNVQEHLLQEARVAARLRHPGIVQVHDCGQEQSQLYIVMEFIPGDNLYQMLRDMKKQAKWLSLDEAVETVRQVCLAVDYAHRQGVLHRDIKPGNIMLEPEPSGSLTHRPVLTDLGLARLIKDQSTGDTDSSGTPPYMSPEQTLGQPTDARSDVYSLGVLLYELVVGRLPFPAKNRSFSCSREINPSEDQLFSNN